MPAHRTPPLTVGEIIDTTLQVTADLGLEAVTMRAVASALGVTPMTLYHHVGDKDALINLVADTVVARVVTPDHGLEWDRWLTEYHANLWKELHRHRGLARFLLLHPTTPAGVEIRRTTVEMLVASGFGERDALLATSTFHTHLLGRLAVDALSTGSDRPPDMPWRSHGLTAFDYTAHGLATILAGLRVLRGP